MKPQIKAAFVAALTSGAYKQCRRMLRNGNEFCASGVLCDLHAKATGGKWFQDTYLNQECRLPGQVALWAGLDFNPKLSWLGLERTMEALNDSGLSLPEIGRLVNEQW